MNWLKRFFHSAELEEAKRRAEIAESELDKALDVIDSLTRANADLRKRLGMQKGATRHV